MDKEVQYYELTEGYEYPVSTFSFDDEAISAYLSATDDTSPIYTDYKLVPPLAVAARALAVLSENAISPPGAVHTSQELEFKKTIAAGESLTMFSKIEKRLDRGVFHTLTTDFDIFNRSREIVMTGKITVACQSAKVKWLRQ